MLVDELGRFASETRYESLEKELVAAVKARILDILGSGLAALRLGSGHAQTRVFSA